MQRSTIVRLASIFLVAGIGLGAFGAHALRGVLDSYGTEIWQKAVFYHLSHALALFCLGAYPVASLQSKRIFLFVVFICAGILLFSGSLYLLALTGVRWWGAVTPFGGSSFLLGWLILAFSARHLEGVK